MVVAIFESLKYVGYMLPVAFLRLYLGYSFFTLALERLRGSFLLEPHLAEYVREAMSYSLAPVWYQSFLENYVLPNWQSFSYFVTYCELLIGLSFLLGFLVRPVSLLGLFLLINYLFNSSPELLDYYRLLITLFVVLFWAGAGRCFGVDYFFYKRRRGLWW